ADLVLPGGDDEVLARQGGGEGGAVARVMVRAGPALDRHRRLRPALAHELLESIRVVHVVRPGAVLGGGGYGRLCRLPHRPRLSRLARGAWGSCRPARLLLMELTPGRRATGVLAVPADDTAMALRSGDVPVLATPRALALLEEATVAAVAPPLTAELTTVGT